MAIAKVARSNQGIPPDPWFCTMVWQVQYVIPVGMVCSVASTMAAIFSIPSTGFRPRPGAISQRQSRPSPGETLPPQNHRIAVHRKRLRYRHIRLSRSRRHNPTAHRHLLRRSMRRDALLQLLQFQVRRRTRLARGPNIIRSLQLVRPFLKHYACNCGFYGEGYSATGDPAGCEKEGYGGEGLRPQSGGAGRRTHAPLEKPRFQRP
jgi:hypothetical protein